MQMYMSKPRLAVVRTAWANRPSPSVQGALFFATDVGVNGGLFQANGSAWVPVAPILIAASAVASSVTGTTSETTLANAGTIPGGALGVNGGLEILTVWGSTTTATKTLRVKYGGTNFLSVTKAAATTVHTDMRKIRNRNAADSQVGNQSSLSTGGFGGTTAAAATGSVDSTVDQTVVITGQLANSADTLTLEMYEVWLTQ